MFHVNALIDLIKIELKLIENNDKYPKYIINTFHSFTLKKEYIDLYPDINWNDMKFIPLKKLLYVDDSVFVISRHIFQLFTGIKRIMIGPCYGKPDQHTCKFSFLLLLDEISCYQSLFRKNNLEICIWSFNEGCNFENFLMPMIVNEYKSNNLEIEIRRNEWGEVFINIHHKNCDEEE